jgi:hypothetical protein
MCREKRATSIEKKTAAEAAVATSLDRERCRQLRPRDRDVPDEDDERGAEEAPELGRLDPDERTPDEPEYDRDGGRADDEDLPDDGAPRTDGARVVGDPDPMVRLGRVGEVRGTMTGRTRLEDELGRPPPTWGETGCRTRGEEVERALGRDDELRVLGRVGAYRPATDEAELRVVGWVDGPPTPGSDRPLFEPPDELAGGWLERLVGAVVEGLTSDRLPPLCGTDRPGR